VEAAVSRRAATITQADVARAIRAAKQAGADAIEVRRDGTIVVHLKDAPPLSPADDHDTKPAVIL